MKTDRRGFLGRLALGAAAVVGASAALRVAEAAEIDPVAAKIDAVLANPEKYPEITARAREIQGCNSGINLSALQNVTIKDCTISGGIQPWPKPFTGTLGPGTYLAPPAGYQWPSGTIIQGAGHDQTTIVGTVGLAPDARNVTIRDVRISPSRAMSTFEAMARDCAAQGCSLRDEGEVETHPVRRYAHAPWLTRGHFGRLEVDVFALTTDEHDIA
jgi:hypothetical protein